MFERIGKNKFVGYSTKHAHDPVGVDIKQKQSKGMIKPFKDIWEREEELSAKDTKLNHVLKELDAQLEQVTDPDYARYLILKNLNDPEADPQGEVELQLLKVKFETIN